MAGAMHVGIVGAGAMGLATAWALLRRGHRVTVFDQGPVPNPLGSSVDEHRLIRFPYGDRAGYTAMVAEAFAAWESVWADLGERLYVETGSLVYGGPEAGYAADCATTLAARGIRVEWLDAGDLRRLYPLLQAEEDTRAFRLGSGGVLLARRIVAGLAGLVAARGGVVASGTPVRAVDPVAGTIMLDGGDTRRFDRVVVAAGPWINRLLPWMAARVTPSRQVLVYLEAPATTAREWEAMPLILDLDRDTERGFYLVPPVAGTGLKVGDHRFSLTGDPDCDREAGLEEARAIMDHCRLRLRGLDQYRIRHSATCFYTVEPKERFQVVTGDRLVALSACSGHGFKFAAVMGLELAALLEGARDAAAVAAWAAGMPQAPVAAASLAT